MPKHVSYIRAISRAQSPDSRAQPDGEVEGRRPHPRVGASLQARRAAELRRVRRARQIQYIDDLNAPRLWQELIERLIRDLDAEGEIEAALEWAASVNVDAMRAFGADRIAHFPLRAAPGASR